jgi:predicted permease
LSAKQKSSVWVRPTFAVIVLVAAAPMISVLISGVIAAALGCPLDEGSPHPCPFMGVDLSEILYSMDVVGWLGLVTLPLGAVAQGVKLGRPKIDRVTERKVRRLLAKGAGILRVAKSLGIGTGTVQRISGERAMSLRGAEQ